MSNKNPQRFSDFRHKNGPDSCPALIISFFIDSFSVCETVLSATQVVPLTSCVLFDQCGQVCCLGQLPKLFNLSLLLICQLVGIFAAVG